MNKLITYNYVIHERMTILSREDIRAENIILSIGLTWAVYCSSVVLMLCQLLQQCWVNGGTHCSNTARQSY